MDLRSTAIASKLVDMGAILAGSDQIWRAADQIRRIRGTNGLAETGGDILRETCFPEGCERDVREKR
jgi:hypothetical protein